MKELENTEAVGIYDDSFKKVSTEKNAEKSSDFIRGKHQTKITKTTDVLASAKEYVKRGWKVIPIPFRAKKPNLFDYPNLALTEEELLKYFDGKPQNIGVLLGVKSNGLTDIDLDSPVAVKIAHFFLPKTTVFGRKSKLNSHYVYECDKDLFRKFNDPFILEANKKLADDEGKEQACLLEFRGSSGQTIFPPSTHKETGELIQWHEEGEPIKIKTAILYRQVSLLATACMLSRFWKKGFRNDLTLSVGGALLRNGFSEEETQNFIRAVAIASGDEEYQSRLDSFEYTVERIKNEGTVWGFPKLIELTDEKAVRTMCEWLEIDFLETKISEKSKKLKHNSTTEQVVKLAEDFRLFHTASGETFAVVPVGSHYENLKITKNELGLQLSNLLWQEDKKAIGNQSLTDALNILRSRAKFDSEQEETFIRFAEKDGSIYIDLGNETWQAVKVSATGWEVIESKDVPVRFRRTRGFMSLPYPTKHNHGIEELKYFVNVSDEDFVLLKAWVISAMRPNYSFPILAIYGGQGSAKSTTTKVLRDLIDPNASPLRSKPRDERDLMIAAKNGWVLSFDNLSSISSEFSDSLCRLATGGGLATRELNTNEDEMIFDAKRPLIINGINELATRSDLLERCVILDLPPIEDNQRQDEQVFNKRLDEAKPRLFSALLDKLSDSMLELPNVRLANKPRMADFAKFAYAGFGNAFLERYTANRDEANEVAVENSPIGEPLLKFLDNLEADYWEGTPTELLEELEKVASDRTKNSKDFPKKANVLSGYITRIKSNLVALGWKTDKRRSGRIRTILFEKISSNDCKLSVPLS